MIDAKIARIRTENHAYVPAETVLADIQTWIEDACDRGQYFCRIPYPCDMYAEGVRKTVHDTLLNLGYTYSVDDCAGGKYLVVNWGSTIPMGTKDFYF